VHGGPSQWVGRGCRLGAAGTLQQWSPHLHGAQHGQEALAHHKGHEEAAGQPRGGGGTGQQESRSCAVSKRWLHDNLLCMVSRHQGVCWGRGSLDGGVDGRACCARLQRLHLGGHQPAQRAPAGRREGTSHETGMRASASPGGPCNRQGTHGHQASHPPVQSDAGNPCHAGASEPAAKPGATHQDQAKPAT